MNASLDNKPVIIGGGIAGLLTALHLAPQPVLLLSKSPLGAETSSAWAQGGLAASLAGDDTPALHLADTLSAGDGLCDASIAWQILAEAPAAIRFLTKIGVRFDRNPSGGLRLGLEAAHGRNRIIHAEGGGSGREIMRALVAAVLATPSIEVIEAIEARRLTTSENSITGVIAHGATGEVFISTSRIVLATGGIGGLFLDSTNPIGAFGQGLALAARAGACLADVEFIQFHPTALDVPTRPLPLISEAIRGEGAVLVDETGQRFVEDLAGAELAPRDILTRAIWQHQVAGHRVFLDVRQQPGMNFAKRFPRINSVCKTAGFDPAAAAIPIRPAQHYHMGGVAVDIAGRSSVQGLWACGELACTGLHGANRLASNSLTEAAVCARWVAESIATTPACRIPQDRLPKLSRPDPSLLRPVISAALGIMRDAEKLQAAISTLLPLVLENDEASDPAVVGLMLAVGALQREESRGAHYRTDFPQKAAIGKRSLLTLRGALDAAQEIGSKATTLARWG
jgi:L-aspartate oxidase